MRAKQEQKAVSRDTVQQKSLVDQLGDLAKQNKAAYDDALVDFRASFTLQPSMNFSTTDE